VPPPQEAAAAARVAVPPAVARAVLPARVGCGGGRGGDGGRGCGGRGRDDRRHGGGRRGGRGGRVVVAVAGVMAAEAGLEATARRVVKSSSDPFPYLVGDWWG